MESSGMQDTGPRIDEHFDRIRANLIRCEECNENFFFDFLRHPRCVHYNGRYLYLSSATSSCFLFIEQFD